VQNLGFAVGVADKQMAESEIPRVEMNRFHIIHISIEGGMYMRFTGVVFLLVFVVAGSLVSSGVYADDVVFQETQVTLEGGIQGILVEPQEKAQVPVVLMLHGFGSHKDEVGDMYKRLAEALGKQDIASLRIDFRGWGESAGKMEESTIQGQIDDAATAYTYLQGLPFVDQTRIGVVGFSLGGGIAVISATQHPEWYKSMVTWSSVGDFRPDFLSLGQDNFDRAAQEGTVTINLGWREVTLGDGFFKSLDFNSSINVGVREAAASLVTPIIPGFG